MSKHYLGISVALIALVALSSCKVTPLASGSPALITDISSGVIFPITLTSDDPVIKKNGCEIKIDNRSSGETFKFKVSIEEPYQFIRAPEGTYRIASVFCSTHIKWIMTRRWPDFHAYPGKLSVFSPHILAALKEGQPSKFRTQKKLGAVQALSALYNIVPSRSKDRLVSAYSGDRLTAAMLESSVRTDQISSVSNPTKPILHWHPKFQACYDSEHSRNELFAGSLEVHALYENGVATSASIETSPNTFTEQFQKCVLSAARSYKSNLTEKLEARYYF